MKKHSWVYELLLALVSITAIALFAAGFQLFTAYGDQLK
jgi:hypothetical protein